MHERVGGGVEVGIRGKSAQPAADPPPFVLFSSIIFVRIAGSLEGKNYEISKSKLRR